MISLVPLAALLAAGAEQPWVSVDLPVIGQYGALGIVAGLSVAFVRTAYKRETQRADRLEQELAALNTTVREQYIPAMQSSAHVLQEVMVVLRDVQHQREMDEVRREVRGGSG